MWLDYVKQKEEGKGVMGKGFKKLQGAGVERGRGGSQIYAARKNGGKKTNAKLLALLINKHFTDYVEKCENHPDRIISCKIKLHGKKSLQIKQVYAPTGNHDNETEMFFEKLEKNLNNKACSYHVVMREFNAKIGMRNKT